MRAFLQGSGDIGRDLLAVDWDATPLGQPEVWPQALRNSVRILLTSRFSMWMGWGPELTFFCNDAYRRDTLATKYPWALGRPASEVWSEIWSDIEPRIGRVLTTGEATWDESLQLFLERSGYVEETYHTFSYSPLVDDDNVVGGMLCVVQETTEQVIAQRRMATLRDLGLGGSELTEAETVAAACRRLRTNPWALPFLLVYLYDDTGRTAVRAGSVGFEGEHPAAPTMLDVEDPAVPWPADRLLTGETVVVESLPARFPALPCGAWDLPPETALVVPLVQPTSSTPYGFLVAGLNRYRPLDDSYRGFLGLVAGHLSAAITDARAYEFERRRAESLAALDQAKTDFFTNVSHEFRTPLTLLLGPTEDALTDTANPLPPEQRHRLELVQRNGRRLLKLVNSLLDFSRIEAGGVASRFEAVDLPGYTATLAAMFESAAQRAGLKLVVDCPPLAAAVHVDREHWAKIVVNLLSNAVKFTFDGAITVRLREDAGSAVLSVTDTGVGIPEQEIPHLFERFHRVKGARARTYEGSGIGLALVAELAAAHGGSVHADSEEGVGSTFTVTVPTGTRHLPARQLVAVQPEEPPAPVPMIAEGYVSEALRWLSPTRPDAPSDTRAGAGRPPGGLSALAPGVAPATEPSGGTAPAAPDELPVADRPRVLVVDDNADMRDYLAGLLAAEYDVRVASDGLQALQVARAQRPDLVLTDVMMPNLDGFGLLERLRDDPLTVGVPVVMVSARAGGEGTVEGLEAGADDYLVKPFSARELLARVRVNLELDRVRRVRGALEHSRDLLDQAQRMAKVGSWELDLASGEILVSQEMQRLVGRDQAEIGRLGFQGLLRELVHPDDRDRVRALLSDVDPGVPVSYETRVLLPSGEERIVAVRGELSADDRGRPRVLRGTVQDVTEQRQAERALAEAAAIERTAAREHSIADELQRSLLPERSFDVEHLEVATFYRAGVEGTQVGGDWYDLIDLGAGRTAFVIGDVMGRGVGAAASMGQLRSAVRALAKLDLPPGELLEHLDGMVQDSAADRIVTCCYGVFDSTDQTLRFANAGHLPPLLSSKDGSVRRLGEAGPPLGAGGFGLRTEAVPLEQDAMFVFYTDGLVEQRGRDIDVGIDTLAGLLGDSVSLPVEGLPERLVERLVPGGPDDDIAMLVARVDAAPFVAAVSRRLDMGGMAVADARRTVAGHLRTWKVPEDTVQELVLMTSELVTNAITHGRPPIDLRVRRTASEVVLEVQDRAMYRPRRRRAEHDDEHGRGLFIVSVLADRWGSRATGNGKSVWASRTLPLER